jgi:hypothetical protein
VSWAAAALRRVRNCMSMMIQLGMRAF